MPEKTNELADTIAAFAITYGVRVVGVIVLLFAAWLAAGWAGRIAARGMRKSKIDESLTRFTARLVRVLIMLLAVIAALSIFGVETTSAAAVIGAAGLAIGLAFQGTLSNFSSGVLLLVFRPFGVGDVVRAAGQLGIVDEIELFTTTINTFDNRKIIVPNREIFDSTIENITAYDTRRVDVAVGVAYNADMDKTREVLLKAAGSVPDQLPDKEPAVIVLEFGDSSINWSVRVWTESPKYWDVYQALMRAVKIHLDEAGISIPFPQMDVHLDKAEG